MKKILLFAAAVMMLAISCSKEDEVTGLPEYGKLNKEKTVFYASTEGATTPQTGTKVFADEDLRVLWNENDYISIFNYANVNDKYMFDGEDGDNGGSFSFEEEGPEPSVPVDLDHIYAVYPYSTNTEASINDSQVTVAVDLPAEQAYQEHSFGIGANTMVAVTDNNFLGFKNACGYLKFRFYGNNVTVKSITLEGNNGEKIAGKASITPSIDSAPTIAMDDAATTSITLNCTNPVTLTSSKITDFIFVIPPTTFTKGFKVIIDTEQGWFFEKTSTKSLTISRNKMESMGIMKVAQQFVQFDDVNFKNYCVTNFDTDGDGEISLFEAASVKRIDMNQTSLSNQVSSMKGIECFKNLTYLRSKGGRTRLSSLDLSSNTKLDTLICDYNNLTILDVSNNTSLTFLSCTQNKLASLNAIGCSALETLYCYRNQLTNLNVDGCIAMTELRCEYNQLTSLDVSNNTALTRLYCHSNQLTNLDLSENTALIRLSCVMNQLTSLNVSNNTSLKWLYCHTNQLTSLDVSNNTNLDSLVCDSNQLTSLDVSNNTELESLSCGSNQLTSLDVSNNTALTQLACGSNQLTSLNVSGCSALTRLYCYNNQLTSLNVSECTALTGLYCYNNQLTSLNVSKNIQLNTLSAWPQEETLLQLWKKSGQSITYKNADNSTIVPSDYGTEIIEVD